MIKYMDKIIIACMVGAAVGAIFLSVTDRLLYVG